MGIMIFQIFLFAYNVQGLGLLGDTVSAKAVAVAAIVTMLYSCYGLISGNREALGWAVLSTSVIVAVRSVAIFFIQGGIALGVTLGLASSIVLFGVYLDRDDL